MKLFENPSDYSRLTERPLNDTAQLNAQVQQILDTVKQDGDVALRRFSAQFDKVEINNFSVSKAEIEAAAAQVSSALRKAIAQAMRNIQKFHAAQIVEEAPVVVLYYDQVLRFTHKNVSGLSTNSMNGLSLKTVQKTTSPK